MALSDDVELLRKIPIFSNVELSKLKLLAFAGEHVRFDAGQEVFHQGDLGDAAYVIIEGTADVMIDAGTGPMKILELGRHAFLGEIAIICDVPRTATIVAQTELHTLRISKELFFRMVEEFPQMATEVMKALAFRLENTTKDLTQARVKLRDAGIEETEGD